jgi:small conductance mechanosensitive channel
MDISVSRGVELWQQVVTILTTYGLDVVGALVTLIIGWIIAGRIKALVHRALGRVPRFDPTLTSFFGSLARYVVIAVTIVAVLDQFGVETASLLAVLGAAGLAIGLALQGTLSNVAAGVMLLTFRPFKIGDYVEAAGLAGTVTSINLFITEMTTPDNVQIIAPNGQMWGAAVKNYSHHATRRVELVIGIAYEDDID